MTKTAFIRLAVLVAAGSLLLSGCASRETLLETPHAVIRTETSAWTNDADRFSYVDSDRQLKPLTECEWPGLFEDRYCENEDGSVRFSYTVHKGNVNNGKLTIDGEVIPLSCSWLDDMSEQGCMPNH